MASTPYVQPPACLEDRAVREQLARILASPLFRHSRHYPALLKYVVEQKLEGRSAHLKERALGAQVFGRDADYDSNLDPVVRTSACEVRKRLAQYYHEEAHAAELRIELPAGSYVPEFRMPEPPAGQVHELPKAAAAGLVPRPPRRPWTAYGAAAALALIAIGIAAAELRPHASPVDSFWGPVWEGQDSILLCVAPAWPRPSESSQPPTYLEVMRNDQMAFADALTMARLTGLIEQNRHKTEIRRSTDFNLADFRKGPAILVGAFNNPWTMRLADQLRFSFDRGPGHTGFIRDRRNPSKVLWRHDANQPYSQVFEDWAIVSRFVDPHTEQIVVVVAGMGKDGTAAAGEFVTGARYLQMLAERAPKGWERKNLQVVLKTEIINGNVGPPRIVETWFW